MIKASKGALEVVKHIVKEEISGKKIDNVLYEHYAELIKQEKDGYDLANDEAGEKRLREECERVKIELSSAYQAQVTLRELTPGVSY